jgi:hypothetical protein
MNIDYQFEKGKHKGRSLINVWRGDNEYYIYDYVNELCQIISRNLTKDIKIPFPNCNIDSIKDDYSKLLHSKGYINMTVTKEYIIIEGFSNYYVELAKRFLKNVLNSEFKYFYSVSTLSPPIDDVLVELPCDKLIICDIIFINDITFLLKCKQKINGKDYFRFEVVGDDFFVNNKLIKYLEEARNSLEKKVSVLIDYPIINNNLSNIELSITLKIEEMSEFEMYQLKPINDMNNLISEKKDGLDYFVQTKIVNRKALHQKYFDRSNSDSEVYSEGAKKLLNSIGDPSYIDYCLRSWDDFYLSYDDLEILKNQIKPKYLKIRIDDVNSNILKYNLEYFDYNYPFSLKTERINEEKYKELSKIQLRNENDDYEQKRYDEFDGIYGFDDDTINDAFEGDPDNYWNID